MNFYKKKLTFAIAMSFQTLKYVKNMLLHFSAITLKKFNRHDHFTWIQINQYHDFPPV